MAKWVRRHQKYSDDFPTPPWATRALFEYVIPNEHDRLGRIWEPACGEGHMLQVLRAYRPDAYGSDLNDYGCGFDKVDFLKAKRDCDWIITNPPFTVANQFASHALDLAQIGVALLVRVNWLEGGDRYRDLLKDRPPTRIGFFSGRVNMSMGQLTAESSSMIFYCWVIWQKGMKPQAPVWIPPDARARLEREGDYQSRRNKNPTKHPGKFV